MEERDFRQEYISKEQIILNNLYECVRLVLSLTPSRSLRDAELHELTEDLMQPFLPPGRLFRADFTLAMTDLVNNGEVTVDSSPEGGEVFCLVPLEARQAPQPKPLPNLALPWYDNVDYRGPVS